MESPQGAAAAAAHVPGAKRWHTSMVAVSVPRPSLPAAQCAPGTSCRCVCVQVDSQGYCAEAGERLKVVDLQDAEW